MLYVTAFLNALYHMLLLLALRVSQDRKGVIEDKRMRRDLHPFHPIPLSLLLSRSLRQNR